MVHCVVSLFIGPSVLLFSFSAIVRKYVGYRTSLLKSEFRIVYNIIVYLY